jgi:hypothetical protein
MNLAIIIYVYLTEKFRFILIESNYLDLIYFLYQFEYFAFDLLSQFCHQRFWQAINFTISNKHQSPNAIIRRSGR